MNAGKATIEIVQGDITNETVDAIVNAANSRLAGGGGVDGAIHRAGGPAIMEACRALGGCPTGGAKATSAGNLAAKHVIHAVGPVYEGGTRGEAELLASAYRSSLEVAESLGAESIAFPAISCGVYGYPVDEAAAIALATVRECLGAGTGIRRVRFVLFSRDIREAFERAFAASSGGPAA